MSANVKRAEAITIISIINSEHQNDNRLTKFYYYNLSKSVFLHKKCRIGKKDLHFSLLSSRMYYGFKSNFAIIN